MYATAVNFQRNDVHPKQHALTELYFNLCFGRSYVYIHFMSEMRLFLCKTGLLFFVCLFCFECCSFNGWEVFSKYGIHSINLLLDVNKKIRDIPSLMLKAILLFVLYIFLDKKIVWNMSKNTCIVLPDNSLFLLKYLLQFYTGVIKYYTYYLI